MIFEEELLSNLQVTPNSITSVTLTWLDNNNGEEGFKIDRKLNSGAWEIEYAIPGSNQLSFTNNDVNWQTNTYSYRVTTFYGRYNSSSVESAISWPKVATNAASNVTYNSATSGGSISIQGNYSIMERGVCYGTSLNPDLTGTHVISGSGVGSYTSDISGLNNGTTYYLRAYATSNVETEYGNNISINTVALVMGDYYGGGIVFYLDGSGGGLVCAPFDQSNAAEWGCDGTTIGGTGTGIGIGVANTAAIVSGCNEIGIAAKICSDLVLNGYSDWFLPSKDELNLIYQNLKIAGIGGFASAYYWSSSEYSSYVAWGQLLTNGLQYTNDKSIPVNVRAVRAF